VHVDELGEQELDPVVLDDSPDVVFILRGVVHAGGISGAVVLHNGRRHP